jgi:hypothetical protein
VAASSVQRTTSLQRFVSHPGSGIPSTGSFNQQLGGSGRELAQAGSGWLPGKRVTSKMRCYCTVLVLEFEVRPASVNDRSRYSTPFLSAESCICLFCFLSRRVWEILLYALTMLMSLVSLLRLTKRKHAVPPSVVCTPSFQHEAPAVVVRKVLLAAAGTIAFFSRRGENERMSESTFSCSPLQPPDLRRIEDSHVNISKPHSGSPV